LQVVLVSTGPQRQADIDLVRRAIIDELKIHVRILDQGHVLEEAQRKRLADAVPDISAFDDHSFANVRAIFDWDHQIPSHFTLLRILCCYDEETTKRVDHAIAERDHMIETDNLYPEFDLPDYDDIEGNETYIAILRAGTLKLEDIRLISMWRRNVKAELAAAAITTVQQDARYQQASAARQAAGLGGPVVMGWAPPCLSTTEHWGIEVSLLTEFDGHRGRAWVFIVVPEENRVTRAYETDVQLA
jgi:hypothetical protein